MGGLEWGLLAISFFIITLLGWLGLTVLLTAERRNWCVWLIGFAMLTGAALVAVHAVVISHSAYGQSPFAVSQWPLAWVVGILQPSAWYLAVLWHAGFWENRRAMRHYRVHTGAFFSLIVVLGTAALLVICDPIVHQHPRILVSAFDPATFLAGPYLGRLPVTALGYFVLILACIGLALDAVYHPAPSRRLMGNEARERARPWLVATTFVMLLLSVLVCGVFITFLPELLFIASKNLPTATAHAMAWLDLAMAALIAIAVLLIGQAVVSYEIFTGKVLLRQGLRRRWQGAVLLAAGCSVLLALGIVVQVPPIIAVLLVIMLAAALYAVSTWRGFVEHERAVENLRRLNTGPQLYNMVISGGAAEDVTAFGTLCAQVFGVQVAYLWPLGSLATLLHPLACPPEASVPHGLAALAADFPTPSTLCAPLDPAQYGGTIWAVPLWGERGLNGLLLLGPKQDGGLFTQEEMEMARTAGERLLDGLASAELARRLIQLQRTRLAESQVVDQRTRRALHDDVLPQLHTTMLAMSAGQLDSAQVVAQLADTHRQIANILHAMPATSASAVTTHGVLGALHRFIEGDQREVFAGVQWEITDEAKVHLAALPPLSAEVLYGAAREAVRNAAKHAAGTQTDRHLHLRITAELHDTLRLHIEDDGVGLAAPTASRAGSGHGMALHSTMMAVIGGSWETASLPNTFTRVTLTL